MRTPTTNRPRGFLLLEMVLAISIFAMAATGFVMALQGMSKTAAHAQRELKVTRILESALNETLSLPVLQEGELTDIAGEGSFDILIRIEPLEDLENEEGETLNEMFRIGIRARWYEEGEWQERAIETWRYSRLYQP